MPGLTLAARILGDPFGFVITNQTDSIGQRYKYTIPVGYEDPYLEPVAVSVPPGSHFPYGYAVDPD